MMKTTERYQETLGLTGHGTAARFQLGACTGGAGLGRDCSCSIGKGGGGEGRCMITGGGAGFTGAGAAVRKTVLQLGQRTFCPISFSVIVSGVEQDGHLISGKGYLTFHRPSEVLGD